LAANIPSRNRIINGMTKGILVVEAAKKSGAMITAEFAADEGHEVYCIPGSIYLPNSIGCHSLIKSGAQLVDRPEDILNDLELNFGSKQKIENLSLFASEGAEAVSELAKQLMDIMTQEPVTLEELVELSGRSLAEISGELLDLQMQGKLGLAVGRRYYRI
ncbi:DNA-processing protein DprA, partial [Phascolarctobacterium faecium]|uniref:DNA-processing protein DprA n=1 Tax=Phascolarctobacterium faecium TaxID=33025 RepID=UPI0040273120